MGNCNSAKKRDLKREGQVKDQGSRSGTNHGQKSSPQQNISKNGNQNTTGVDASIPSSYTDKKLKQKEYFKSLIERTQLKLIDVSQSPGGILDWGDSTQENAPMEGGSKFSILPQNPICKSIFHLKGVQATQIEDAVNMDLIRLEELDMMVYAMNLQEKKMSSLNIISPGELVVQLEILQE